MRSLRYFVLCGCIGIFPTSTVTLAATPPSIIGAENSANWYPPTKKKLSETLDGYFKTVKPQGQKKPLALIAPHAGYVYSGKVAAEAYIHLQPDRYSRVLVLGPSHHLDLSNAIIIPDADLYRTVYGSVSLDRPFLEAMARSSLVKSLNQPFSKEHSIDNQLPFLQHRLGSFRLVPIIVGRLDRKTVDAVAAILRPLLDEDTLVVVSSDFTHYGPWYHYIPFTKDVRKNLTKLDDQAASLIISGNNDTFRSFVEKTGVTICGYHPLSLLLAMLPPDREIQKVGYDISAGKDENITNSVSYLSFALYGNWMKKGKTMAKKTEQPSIDPPEQQISLDQSDKTTLLTLARQSILTYLTTGKTLSKQDVGLKISDRIVEKAGAFVTLKRKGMLRGCIGEIPAKRPLIEVVIDHAIDAAVNDPRFPPLTREELSDLHIEISVLTPPRVVASYKEIIVGRHGVYLQKQGHSAVFLPQVATEQGWDLGTTLGHLARKAGLNDKAWRSGATFQVFEAIIFAEAESH